MSSSNSRQKLLTELRRRGWLVLLTMLVTVTAALFIAGSAGNTFTAEAVLVVRATGPETEEPSSSPKLAATYATLIPLDPRIERSIAAGLPPDASWSFSTTNDPNTALIHLDLSADRRDLALTGTELAVRSIAGQHPASPNITPRTVAIAKLPNSVSESSFTTQSIVVMALLLGFLLGLILVGFWRAGDARIDTVDELGRLLKCPLFEIRFGRKTGLGPLFDALGNREGRTIALVPCRERDQLGLKSLALILRNAFGKDAIRPGGVPGSTAAGELTAAEADVTALVLTPGVRTAELKEAVDAIDRYKVAPSYAVLAVEARVSDGAGRTTDSSEPAQPPQTIEP